MKELIRMTRMVHNCYMDWDDNLYDKPIGAIGKRNLNKRSDDFLKKYITLIMKTKIVSGTTKIYIRSTLPSVASVIKSWNQTLPEEKHINIKTAQSMVNYDSLKISKYFAVDNMINQVISNRSCDLAEYEKSYNHANADYAMKNKLDNLKLKLRRVSIQDSLEESEFNDLLSMISPYFSKHIKYLEENISHNSVGYLQYLMSTPTQQLTGEHKERYELIRKMLE